MYKYTFQFLIGETRIRDPVSIQSDYTPASHYKLPGAPCKLIFRCILRTQVLGKIILAFSRSIERRKSLLATRVGTLYA